jgi:hypothetical protein
MFLAMNLAELKNNVLALPETERHDLIAWLDAEIRDQDDRRPTARASKHIGLSRLLETDPLKLTPEQFRASMEVDFFEQ